MLERFTVNREWTKGPKWALAAGMAVFFGFANFACATNDCNRLAVKILKQYSPTGLDSYQVTQDKTVFETFSEKCDDREEFLDGDLITAVHETVHLIRAEREVYHLVSNELLPVPPAPDYFAPSLVVPALSKIESIKNDIFFQTYLTGEGPDAASSRDEFTYLLDELNAYTNEMRTQIDLVPIHPFANRAAGVPALMTFVAAYVSGARSLAPAVYRDLTATPASATRRAVARLWTQAEDILRQGCIVAPTTPNDNAVYVRYLCTEARTADLSKVLGRPARCPTECSADLDGPP